MVERFKRRRDENKLEFKILDGIKKDSIQHYLNHSRVHGSQMLDFIGKVLLGRVLFKVLEWMGNKENQGKLNSIIKFFEDWWPVLIRWVLDYLVMDLTGFAVGIIEKCCSLGSKISSNSYSSTFKSCCCLGSVGNSCGCCSGGRNIFGYEQVKKMKNLLLIKKWGMMV